MTPPSASSRELPIAIAIAVLCLIAFGAVALSTVSARSDLDDLERSIETSIEATSEAGDLEIPRLGCNQVGIGEFRCVIAASEDDPAGARSTYPVLLGEDGCWRLIVGDGGLAALGIRVVRGCIDG